MFFRRGVRLFEAIRKVQKTALTSLPNQFGRLSATVQPADKKHGQEMFPDIGFELGKLLKADRVMCIHRADLMFAVPQELRKHALRELFLISEY